MAYMYAYSRMALYNTTQVPRQMFSEKDELAQMRWELTTLHILDTGFNSSYSGSSGFAITNTQLKQMHLNLINRYI